MKIYFAYRTGYLSNHRFIKEFQADSILDFFQKNWQILSSENYSNFLGTEVYGFPISYWENEADESPSMPPLPTSFEELTENLENAYVYCNEVKGNSDCLQVQTDDDEIELAWYVFTEDYKNKNLEKIALWLNPDLPLEINEKNNLAVTLSSNNCLKLSDDVTKNCFLMSSAIYDSSNFEDMQFIHIQGADLANLVMALKTFDFETIRKDDYLSFGFYELNVFQQMIRKFNLTDLPSVIRKFNQFPATDTDLSELEDWDTVDLGNHPENSRLKLHEHIVEFGIADHFCYQYYILFDEKWANSHPILAKSIQQFGMTWEI